ncbi:MAG: cytochrome c3 family protein [Coriobacteriia bacterium]|nr:cytochrome c3 family protein [Coriobacteriia bacterium]
MEAEFARASHHPVMNDEPTMTASPETETVFSQATRPEFDLSLLNNTSNLTEEGPELFYGTVPMAARANQNMLFFADSAGVQQYDVDVNGGLVSWNDDGFNPPDVPAGRQMLAFTRASDRLVLLARSASAQELWEYSLPTALSPGVWSVVSTLPTNGSGTLDNPVGADVAYDPVGNAVWVLPGSGTTSVYRWNIASRTRDDMSVFDTAGVPIQFGQGSALAYSETPRALWLIRSLASGSTRQGYLYRVDEPGANPTSVTATDTNLHVGGWNAAYMQHQTKQYDAVWNNYKMTRYRKAGADYLYILGQDTDHDWIPSTITISDLTSATPTMAPKGHGYPWSVANNAEYVKRGDIEWDGGDYVYVTNASTPSYWYFGTVAGAPACLKRVNVVTGVYETLTPNTGYDGGLVAKATATPPANSMGTGYAAAGTVTSPEILAQPDAVSWGALTLASEVPSGTALSVKVQGYGGTDWVDLPGLGSITSAADLTGVSVATYPRLRLIAAFATADQSALTPRLLSWAVTAARAGRLYVADTKAVPSLAWNVLRSPNAVDTRELMNATATLPTVSRYIAPFQDRVVYGIGGSQSGVYYPKTQTWGDSRVGITIPAIVFYRYSDSVDCEAFGNRIWVPRVLVDGTPGMRMLPSGPSPVWSSYDGTAINGSGMQRQNSLAVKATGEYWVPSISTATSETVWYYRFDTANPGWKTGPFTIVASDGVTPIYNGWGGSAVYSAQTDTLLLLNRRYNPAGYTQGDGRLYRVTGAYAKMLAGGTIRATDTGVQLSYSGGYYYNAALEIMSIGGTDYAVFHGWNPAGALGTQLVSDLGSATPTLRAIAGVPETTFTNLTFHLSYDGAGTLYYAGTSARFAGISVPSDPVNGTWGAWTVLPNGPWDSVTGITSAVTTITPGITAAYETSTVDSPELLPGDTTEWGSLSWSSTEPSGTDVGMTVQRWSGSAWEDVPGMVDIRTSPVDLGSLATAVNPKLRVRATLYTSDPFLAPTVSGWKVTSGTDRLYAATDEIVPQSGATTWGRALWSAYLPSGAVGRVTVRGWSAAAGAFVEIPGYTELSDVSIDLTGLSVAQWPRLQLRCYLQKALPSDPNPALVSWSVTSIAPARTIGAQLACSSCHEPHAIRVGGTAAWDFARVSDPRGTKATASAAGLSDATSFCVSCHGSSMPEASATVASWVPWTVINGRPLAGSAPVVWNKTAAGAEVTASGHFTSAGGRTDCATCHDPHGSDNARLTAWTRPTWFGGGAAGVRDNSASAAGEENLCYQCHGNGTVGRLAQGAQDVASPATAGYSHPIAAGGLHASGEPTAALGSGNRHSECTDCHDPHAARPGTHIVGSSTPAPALRGAWGVKPRWGADTGSAAQSFTYTRFTGQATAREAYLCFKCHSSYTSLAETGTFEGVGGTDLTAEFNPSNQSYHNVLGLAEGVRTSFKLGTETYSWPWAGGLKAPMTSSSGMTCTDCHSGGSFAQAKGPHGSSVKHMLDPNYPSDWASAGIDYIDSPNGMYPSNIICAKCHDFTLGDNRVHRAGGISRTGGEPVHSLGNNHSDGARCNSCHVGIPHGWKRPRLLGYSSDPAPYRTRVYGSWGPLTGILIGSKSPSGWEKTDCTGCSGYAHPGSFGTSRWP